MSGKSKVSMPGVAEGKQLIGIPTGDEFTAADRVRALLEGSMAQGVYQVSFLF